MHRALRKMESEGQIGFLGRVTVTHGGAGRNKQGDSARNLWRIAALGRSKLEGRFFVRCTAGEMRSLHQDDERKFPRIIDAESNG